MNYQNAMASVLEFLGSDIGKGFNLDDAQGEELALRLTRRVKVDIVMQPEAVLPHAEALFPKPDEAYVSRTTPPKQQQQTREEILKVCAKFFNVDPLDPQKRTFWEAVCPLNPPPITKDAKIGSSINHKVFFAEADRYIAAGKPIRLDVLTDIAAYLSHNNQLERYPAPVEIAPPPPPPTPRELEQKRVKFESKLNDRDSSPIKGAKEHAQPLVQPKAVLTEEQRVALNEKKRAEDSIVAEALSRVNGYTGYSHSRTYSGRAALRDVFQTAMDAGKSAEEVLAAVEAKASQLAGNSSIR